MFSKSTVSVCSLLTAPYAAIIVWFLCCFCCRFPFFCFVLLSFQFVFLATLLAVDIPNNAGKLFPFNWLAQFRLMHCFGVWVGLLDGDPAAVLSLHVVEVSHCAAVVPPSESCWHKSRLLVAFCKHLPFTCFFTPLQPGTHTCDIISLLPPHLTFRALCGCQQNHLRCYVTTCIMRSNLFTFWKVHHL